MTPRQSQVLLFIDMYWEDNACAPTYDEIKDHIGVKSKSGIHRIINLLEASGYIVYIKGRNRTVRPTQLPESLIKKKLKLRKEQEQNNG